MRRRCARRQSAREAERGPLCGGAGQEGRAPPEEARRPASQPGLGAGPVLRGAPRQLELADGPGRQAAPNWDQMLPPLGRLAKAAAPGPSATAAAAPCRCKAGGGLAEQEGLLSGSPRGLPRREGGGERQAGRAPLRGGSGTGTQRAGEGKTTNPGSPREAGRPRPVAVRARLPRRLPAARFSSPPRMRVATPPATRRWAPLFRALSRAQPRAEERLSRATEQRPKPRLLISPAHPAEASGVSMVRLSRVKPQRPWLLNKVSLLPLPHAPPGGKSWRRPSRV